MSRKDRNSNGASPDAIAILKKDHAEVSALFKQYADLESEDEKQAVAERICKMLTVHATCEEELVYPPAHEVIADDLVYEAEIEHGSAKALIAQIEASNPSDDAYDATVKVLGEYIAHHVKEEESEMFPQLQKSDLDLQEMGMAIAARKAELAEQVGLNSDDDDGNSDTDRQKNIKSGTAANHSRSPMRAAGIARRS